MKRKVDRTVEYTDRGSSSRASTSGVKKTKYSKKKETTSCPFFTASGGPELKTIDSGTVTGNTAVTAGSLVFLNGVAQGTDYTQRVGRRAVMKSILFRMSLYPSSTTSAPVGENVRFFIVWDKQPNDADPGISDVLASADTYAPLNLNNRDRFVILTDKTFSFAAAQYSAGALTTGSPVVQNFTFYKKMNLESIYNGTGSTISSMETGSIHYGIISQKGSLIGFDYNSRIRFVDP